MEIGELDGLGSDLAVGIGDLETDLADGGLEGRYAGADDGEGGFGVFEGGELGEEVVVTGEDFGAELLLEEADAVLELLGAGGGGAGAEGLGGETGGVEVGGEEGGEDGVGGEGIERRRRGGMNWREVGAVFEGGEALERGGRRDGGEVAVERRSSHGFSGNAGWCLVWGFFLGFLGGRKKEEEKRKVKCPGVDREVSDLRCSLQFAVELPAKAKCRLIFGPFIK